MSDPLMPAAALDQHLIALGKTGAGKSSAVRVLVEDLLERKERVVVITPKSDWWGIKLAADGKHAGYPLVVFGGDHADMPLNHTSGKMMAELLASGNRSAVLQMREFMPAEREQFWGDFAMGLFRLLEGKMYLVIDEVHNFAPKGKVEGKAATMLHWSNKLASESRGLGITLIAASQRPQKVHNDFLTSCETLIAMRVTTQWDRQAIKDWIDGCGDKETGAEVLSTLAQMKRGDAWVWSPEIEFGPKQIHFPMFRTYDSFKPQEPKAVKSLSGWAEVNLEDVRKKLDYVVKEAEANDPNKLRTRIAQLEAEARKKPAATKEVAVADAKAIERAARQVEQGFRTQLGQLEKGMKSAQRTLSLIAEAASSASAKMGPIKPFVLPQVSGAEIQQKGLALERAAQNLSHAAPIRSRQLPPIATEAHTNGDSELTGPMRKILRALAELSAIGKDAPPKAMAAAWAGYSAQGGAFGNPIGTLNSLGLVRYPQPGFVSLTEEGASAIGAQDVPDSSEVRRRIESICTGPERKILTALLENGEGEISKEELAEKSGYSPVGGAFGNPIGALRTKGLLDYPRPGMVRAAEWLFI